MRSDWACWWTALAESWFSCVFFFFFFNPHNYLILKWEWTMLTHLHKFPADNYVLVEEDQEVMNIFWFSIICYAFKYLCSLLKLLPQPCTVLPPFCGLRNRGFEKFDCLPNISQLVKWRKWNLLCPGPFDSLDCAFFDSCHFYILAGVL